MGKRKNLMEAVSNSNKIKYFITGGKGLLGSAVCKRLVQKNIDFIAPSSHELNLLDSEAVTLFVEREQPTYLIHLASKVYGLKGNLENQFLSLSTNTAINNNIFNAVKNSSIQKIFYAGTVASYPYPYINLPLDEEQLFRGNPHDGEYGYAASKIHAYHYLNILSKYHNIESVYGVLTNLYGPNDRFDTDGGHVIPSLIKKAYDAHKKNKPLQVWGKPDTTRDFLYVDDAAEAIILLCDKGNGIYNIASGVTSTMEELVAEVCLAAKIIESAIWQSDMPIGIPHRSVSSNKLQQLGWKPKISLNEGIALAYAWYENNLNIARQ